MHQQEQVAKRRQSRWQDVEDRQRPGRKMELEPQLVNDHCCHHTDAETGRSSIWAVMWGEPPCPGGQGNNWEQQAWAVLCQKKLEASRTESAQKSLGAGLTSTLIRIVRPARRALQGQRMKINHRGDNREVWISTIGRAVHDQGTYCAPNTGVH